MRRLPELPADSPVRPVPDALEPPFRIRAATYSARQVAGYALLTTGSDAPELDHRDVAQPRPARTALDATEQLAVEHASVRSVWFRNSVRSAAGLALAVYIAQRTGLQHGFWVVLGTLSVLRSNAHALQSWYVTLGYAFVNSRPVPPPHIRDTEGSRRLLTCIRDAAGGRDQATVEAALVLLWASQHLDNLWRLEAHLGERANAARGASTDGGRLRKLRSLAS